MRSSWLRLLAASSLAALALLAATRPRYGGALRVEIHDAPLSADAPEAQRRFATLAPYFSLSQWEPGKRAVFTAAEGVQPRPFLDSVEVLMGRTPAEQTLDFNTGRADVVEAGPDELRRLLPARRVWSSEDARLLALVFSGAANAAAREALACAVDRAAIHSFLLQKQGEAAASLLPQWLSGVSFLFPVAQDLPRARAGVAALAPPARRLTWAATGTANRAMMERIALNARDAGLALTPAAAGAAADVRLVEVRLASAEGPRALSALAAALGLPEPARADTAEALYAAERALLDDFRVAPLFHLPDSYAVAQRVNGPGGIGPLGDWRLENLWLEAGR